MISIYDDDYFIPPLSRYSFSFPNPRYGAKEGLLAYGGDLNPNRILNAYRRGIFPWYSEGDPILWWSPEPRLILEPNSFKVSRSFRRVLRNSEYRVTFDRDFKGVITNCSKAPRKNQNGTWLIDEMIEAYSELHSMGWAHSVEVYIDDKLVGGLYGVAIGGVFFGESMFSLKPNSSKIALKALSDVLSKRGYDLIDCQVVTEHLKRLGAKEVSRDDFLNRLEVALNLSVDSSPWREIDWEYSDD